MNYRIVSDSSSNLYTSKGIDYVSVPLTIYYNGNAYPDTAGLDTVSLIETIHAEKGAARTACPSAGDWISAFEGADRVFAITMSSGMSGTYNAACTAAKIYMEQVPDAKVFVIDSLSTGPEMQLIIEKINAWYSAGLRFERICRCISLYQKHTHLLYAVESFNNLYRAGRVSAAVAKLAGILGIRVLGIASPQGTISIVNRFRSEKKALQGIFEEMKKNGYRGGKVRISHCINEDGANRLSSLIRREFPRALIDVLPCTGLCSYYADRGGLIIGFDG